MDKAELELARKRLAFELRQSRFDQELKKRQLATTRGWGVLLTPAGAGVAAAILALLGTAAGKWADYLATSRQLETNIIMKASDVPSTVAIDDQDVVRARNLLWFSRQGFVSLSSTVIAQLEAQAKLKEGQPLEVPIIQSGATVVPTRSAGIASSSQQNGTSEDELSLANQLKEDVKQQRFNEAAQLFPRLQASHFSGVGYSAYPAAAFALDQISKPTEAIRVLELLNARIAQDAVKGYGYLAPNRPPREFLRNDIDGFIGKLNSMDVKAKMQELRNSL